MSKKTTRQNFLERALAVHDDEAIHAIMGEEVAAWHNSVSPHDLPEWLGLSEDEYGDFLEDAEVLPRIVERHRSHAEGLVRVADSDDQTGHPR